MGSSRSNFCNRTQHTGHDENKKERKVLQRKMLCTRVGTTNTADPSLAVMAHTL